MKAFLLVSIQLYNSQGKGKQYNIIKRSQQVVQRKQCRLDQSSRHSIDFELCYDLHPNGLKY